MFLFVYPFHFKFLRDIASKCRLLSSTKRWFSGSIFSAIFSVITPVPAPSSTITVSGSQTIGAVMRSTSDFCDGKGLPVLPKFVIACHMNAVDDMIQLKVINIKIYL